MRTVHKIGIGMLVGLTFASGYATRIQCNQRQEAAIAKADNAVEGTRIASTRLADVANVDIRPLETLYSVLRNLREHYVEQLTVESEGKMTYDALRAMLGSLNDPDTRFIEPAQRKILADAQQGKFHGIGAALAIKQNWKTDKDTKERISEEHLVVVGLLPGSPAAKAGLKPGDEIVAIDGKSVLPFNPFQHVNDMLKDDKIRNMERSQLRKLLEAEQKRIDDGITIIEAENQLVGEAKKPVELTLAAKAPAKERKIDVQPEDLTVAAVEPAEIRADNYAYIKVNYFGAGTAEKFAQAMKDIESKPTQGLILDLRAATGGDIKSAQQLASWFAPNKTLAILLKSRGRKTPVQVPGAQSTGKWSKPLVVLVDRSTARVPEVLAAGLKEAASAKIVGEKTYGDFGDSAVVDLADGSAILMTTGKYVTAKGVDYNGKGLPVDIPATGSDAQLKQAIKVLTAGGKS